MHLCVLGRKLDQLVLLQWPMGMAGNRRGQREGSQVLWPRNGFSGGGVALCSGGMNGIVKRLARNKGGNLWCKV